MEMEKIHVFARSLLSTHGDKAELEAAQKALDCDRHGHKEESGELASHSGRHQGDARPACKLTTARFSKPGKKGAGGSRLTAQWVTH